MKESNQREIELKGVTSKGLEKVIEVIYTSTTTLDGDDIFDVIGAATHMQVVLSDVKRQPEKWFNCLWKVEPVLTVSNWLVIMTWRGGSMVERRLRDRKVAGSPPGLCATT